MRGPEHYAAAQQLLATVLDDDGTPPYVLGADDSAAAWRGQCLAAAQVHATLAVAAAIAGERLGDEDQPWWDDTPTWHSELAYPPQPPRPT